MKTSTCSKNTALFSQNTSRFMSMICRTYLIAVFATTVSRIAYSKPNTNCTDAPFVTVKWYANDTKYRSTRPSKVRSTRNRHRTDTVFVMLPPFPALSSTHGRFLCEITTILWDSFPSAMRIIRVSNLLPQNWLWTEINYVRNPLDLRPASGMFLWIGAERTERWISDWTRPWIRWKLGTFRW